MNTKKIFLLIWWSVTIVWVGKLVSSSNYEKSRLAWEYEISEAKAETSRIKREMEELSAELNMVHTEYQLQSEVLQTEWNASNGVQNAETVQIVIKGLEEAKTSQNEQWVLSSYMLDLYKKLIPAGIYPDLLVGTNYVEYRGRVLQVKYTPYSNGFHVSPSIYRNSQ